MLRHSSDYLPRSEIDRRALHDEGPPHRRSASKSARILRRRWSIIAATAGLHRCWRCSICWPRRPSTPPRPRCWSIHGARTSSNTSQTVLSNFGTDDATIESQALLIKSVRDPAPGRGPNEAHQDEEFVPPPSLLGTIRGLFRFSSSASAIGPEEVAAASRAADLLQRQLKVIRQGTTFLVDINVNSQSPSRRPRSPTPWPTPISRSRSARNMKRPGSPAAGSAARSRA